MKPKNSEATSVQNAETRVSLGYGKKFTYNELETLRETFYRMAMALKDHNHQWNKPDIKLYEQSMRLLK